MSTNGQADRDEFRAALQAIAWGRVGSKPLPGTQVQQIARQVLVRHGVNWWPRPAEKAK